MSEVSIETAESGLRALLERVKKGEEIVIQDGGLPIARLIAAPLTHKKRILGQARGKIKILEGFDEIPPGFEEYAP